MNAYVYEYLKMILKLMTGVAILSIKLLRYAATAYPAEIVIIHKV